MDSRLVEEVRISQGEKMYSQSAVSDDSSTVYTPTHTAEADNMSYVSRLDIREGTNFRAPSPGKTYMIFHRESGKMICLKNGDLNVRKPDQQSGRYWKCVEKDGWLGFRETVSGNVLGHNGKNGFRATMKKHDQWEYFVVVPKGNEGCQLQSLRWPTLKWVGIDSDGRSLVNTTSSDEAALWEFVEA
ncbi:hypothetical protein F5B22DRAFT_648602 [Xylaria bambusicola]|uniref:uncharacterized protein n=1 Tax=Xylaria bambusicola TaxID=326684 RepID=UPI002008CEBF|nr:uncharacterized protein F5B22DRAFT_648602 [Xylaria bambusicola]KAI0512496.1 hypothetical protein F5B22DRAFT_648602 [Xylaria bambusicola]